MGLPSFAGGSAGTHAPRLPWFTHSLVPSQASVQRRLCVRPPRCRGNRQVSRVPSPVFRQCRPRGVYVPPRRALPLRRRYYGPMRQSLPVLLSFGLSLVRGVVAGCYQPRLPTGPSRRYPCESFLGCLAPCHGGPTECPCLFLPRYHRPSPTEVWVGFPLYPRTRFFRGAFFDAADIPLCSDLRVCSSPRSLLPLRLSPQGSRDFYPRAPRVSLPPHAPEMLTARIQAIDGARTCTSPDSQPCRLLPPVYASRQASRPAAQNSGPSGSLLLSREDFSSSASCRFIPAHKFLTFHQHRERASITHVFSSTSREGSKRTFFLGLFSSTSRDYPSYFPPAFFATSLGATE